jgi:hypothetical protein
MDDEAVEFEDVESLMAYLQTLPPKMKLGKRPSGGEVRPRIEAQVVEVAEAKNEPFYYGWLGDSVWKDKLHMFKEPFKVLIFWSF